MHPVTSNNNLIWSNMGKQKLCKTLADLKAEYLYEQEKGNIKLWGKPQSNTLALYLLEYDEDHKKNVYLRVTDEQNRRLSLYVETSIDVRMLNKKIWEIAKKIRNRANDGIFDPQSSKKRKGRLTNLVDYINRISEDELAKTGNRASNYSALQAVKNHVMVYAGDKVTLGDVDLHFVKGFLNYMNNEAVSRSWKADYEPKFKRKTPFVLKPLSPRTKWKMWMYFSACLDRAVKEKLIDANPCREIDRSDIPRTPQWESGIKYLEKDELAKLIETPCNNQDVKNAFLFCCFTGLRFSDVERITWSNFQVNADGVTTLSFTMKKVKRPLTIPVPEFVRQFLPERKEGHEGPIFTLHDNTYANRKLKEWAKDAGIRLKNLTFHVARHTAATFSMNVAGVPLEVVSKLLGHTRVSTTEIYAKVIDQRKVEASMKIDETLNNLFK